MWQERQGGSRRCRCWPCWVFDDVAETRGREVVGRKCRGLPASACGGDEDLLPLNRVRLLVYSAVQCGATAPTVGYLAATTSLVFIAALQQVQLCKVYQRCGRGRRGHGHGQEDGRFGLGRGLGAVLSHVWAQGGHDKQKKWQRLPAVRALVLRSPE